MRALTVRRGALGGTSAWAQEEQRLKLRSSVGLRMRARGGWALRVPAMAGATVKKKKEAGEQSEQRLGIGRQHNEGQTLEAEADRDVDGERTLGGEEMRWVQSYQSGREGM